MTLFILSRSALPHQRSTETRRGLENVHIQLGPIAQTKVHLPNIHPFCLNRSFWFGFDNPSASPNVLSLPAFGTYGLLY